MRSRIIAALSLSLVACSLAATFDGLVGPGDSTDGGATDGTAHADGAQSMQDGSVTEADASPATDGSFDAGTVKDTGAKPDGTVLGYCVNHGGHTFCDDFDQSSMLGNTWSVHTGIGSAALSPFDYTSPPRSLVAVSPSTDGGQDGEDDIEMDFAGSKTADLEAAFKIVAMNAPSADFIAIQFSPLDKTVYNECYFDIAALNNAGTLLEASCQQPDGGSYYASQTLTGALPNWDRVHLSVNMSANQVQGSMAGATKKLGFPPGLTVAKFKILIGAVYKDIGGNATVRVDDVIVDVP